MRRLAAVGLIAGLLVFLVSGTCTATTSVAPDTVHWLRLDISAMSPQVVDGAANSITLSGTITNTADRQISHLKARLQIGGPLNDDADIQLALDGGVAMDHVTPFTPVTDTLAPGQRAPLTLVVPLRGANSLDIAGSGVYPVLVNVNGQPDYGGQTRLAAANFLLPVLGAPGETSPTKPSQPARLTVLWPLVDSRPRIVGADASGHMILSDDELAGSIGPGGRLFGLVDAVSRFASAEPSLMSSLCFAIDPDLLYTVTAMAHGYQVRSGDGQTVAGHGGNAANAWLTALRTLTQGRCVLALPAADADLVALSRVANSPLIHTAVAGGAAEVAAVLKPVQPLTTVAWPISGALDAGTATSLAGQGITVVLMNPNALRPPPVAGPTQISGLPASGLRALPIDALVSSALADPADNPPTSNGTLDATGVAAQNGLAALTYRMVSHQHPDQQVLVTPPRRWTASETELGTFLAAVQRLLADQFAIPQGLADLVNAPATAGASELAYPTAAQVAEIPSDVTSQVMRTDARQRDLVAAMTTDPTSSKTSPNALMEPVTLGELRAMSSAWRGDQTGEAAAAARTAEEQLTTLTDQVAASAPKQTISLASNDSKLPITVDNALPVDITVRIILAQEAGLRTDAIDNPVIPAKSSRTLFIPAKWTRSGRFSVEASLTTPGGTPLGQPARIELVSNAYGIITLVVTGTAFGVLVLLSGWRIYRRVRTRELTAVAGEDKAIGE